MKNHKQQLRVGNILHHIGFGTCKVLGIYNDGNIHICNIKDNDKQHLVLEQFSYRLEEVPITFDLLINAGFKDLSHDNNKMGCRIEVNSSDELCWYRQDNRLRYQTKSNGFTRDFNIKYVHQLQNLYFALTGGELVFSEA